MILSLSIIFHLPAHSVTKYYITPAHGFTSCLPMVGGSHRILQPLKLVAMNDIAEILLKVAIFKRSEAFMT
jgi:hypothetical protein